MNSARRGWWAALLFFPLGFVLAAGCGSPPATTSNQGGTKEGDPLQEAREVARLATDPGAYQKALELVNAYLNAQPGSLAPFQVGAKDRLALAQALGLKEADAQKADAATLEKQLLTGRVGLEEDELREVEATRFSPLDSHYLDFCFQLRDAARSLRLGERPGAGEAVRWQDRLAQIKQAFAWVTRQVAFDPASVDLQPAEFALRLGRGGPRERALVFLALLQQMDVEGCVLAYPGKGGPVYWLAGALLPDKGGGHIYLFDPRLGLPLPGPDGGVATLAQLRKQPEILKRLNAGKPYDYDVTPKQAGAAEVYLVLPLSALSARMRFLEDEVFSAHDRVNLALRPERLIEHFTAAGVGPVHVWNERAAPGRAPPSTPTRVLRQSLPPAEGGVDATGARYARFRHRLVPWFAIDQALHEMQIDENPGPIAEGPLKALIEELFQMYVQAPRQQILRGRFEDASRRLVRLEKALDEYASAQGDEAAFAEQLGRWRERINQAFREGREQKVREIMLEEDTMFQALRFPEEVSVDRKSLRKGALGVILFRAAGDVLRKEIAYLQALRWQEKAERQQARLDRLATAKGGAKARVEQDAADAWQNAQSSWSQYEQKVTISPAVLQGRVLEVRALAQAHRADRARAALVVLQGEDYLFYDLIRSLAARAMQARSLRAAGNDAGAARVLEGSLGQVEALTAAKELQGLHRGILLVTHWPAYAAKLESRQLQPPATSAK